MKRKTILLAAMLLTIGLTASPRRAIPGGLRDIDIGGLNNAEIKQVSDEPPACPNLFENPQPITGRVVDLTVTPVGSWFCKDNALQFEARRQAGLVLSFSRGGEEHCIDPQAIAKLTMAGKTVLIVASDAERLKATLAVANAAKLSTTSNVEIQATHALGCPADVYFAVMMTLK